MIARALRSGVLRELFAGDDAGTLVPREVAPLRARQHWIAFTLRPSGVLLLDRGAVEAVRAGKSSLCRSGSRASLANSTPVTPCASIGPDGLEVGRGLTRLNVLDAARCAGKKATTWTTSSAPKATKSS